MNWIPPSRPEWLAKFNSEASAFNIQDAVPLRAQELIDTATASLGLSDFGDDRWREPFEVLVQAIETESELNFFGRLFTREELLRGLKVRLQIAAEFKAHPEIDDEIITEPVFITGLSRSGTSILFERLAADSRFKPLLSWEIFDPCPPPDSATYDSDPRIEQVEHFMTLYNRLAPNFKAMHEMGARIPNECSEAFLYSFHTENLAARVHVPSYMEWLLQHGDWQYTYDYHKRFLKLLQWKNPRRHWLLKAPPHMWHLPELFNTFPDAKVLYTHRDPLRASASNMSLLGTLCWMRSDRPFDSRSFERLLSPEVMSVALNSIIDQFESGAVPKDKVRHVLYDDLVNKPFDSIVNIYERLNYSMSVDTERALKAFIKSKPQGKFGEHNYKTLSRAEEGPARQLFERYQSYYKVPNE